MWLSLGAIAAVFVLGASYLFLGVAQIDPFRRHITVMMVLDDAAGLLPGSPVLVRGIEVGEVSAVDVAPGGVQVMLALDEAEQVPAQSSVRVENLSALGETYVDFRPSTTDGPYLIDGQLVSSELIDASMSIPMVARSVTGLLNELDPTVLASLTNTLDESLAGTGSVTPKLQRSAELLSATLLTRLPEIRQLSVDLQAMGGNMSWLEPSARASSPLWTLFAQRFSEIVDSLARVSKAGDAPRMYVEGDGLIPQLERVTDWVEREGPTLAAIAPVLQPLVSGGLQPIDLSALITQALGAVDEDGAVRVEVNPK